MKILFLGSNFVQKCVPSYKKTASLVKTKSKFGPLLKVGGILALIIIAFKYSTEISDFVTPYTGEISSGIQTASSEAAKHTRVIWVKTGETVNTAVTSISNLFPPVVTDNVNIAMVSIQTSFGYVYGYVDYPIELAKQNILSGANQNFDSISAFIREHFDSIFDFLRETSSSACTSATELAQNGSILVQNGIGLCRNGMASVASYIPAQFSIDQNAIADRIGEILIYIHQTIHPESAQSPAA